MQLSSWGEKAIILVFPGLIYSTPVGIHMHRCIHTVSLQYLSLMKELGESVPDGGANGAGKGSKAGVGVSGAIPPPLIPGQPPPWMQAPQFPPHMPPHGHPPPPHMMMHPHPGGGQSLSL